MPESVNPANAGWYDDPQDPQQLRYFDGVLWTDHVTPRTTRVAMPQPGDLGWAPPSAPVGGNPYAAPAPGYSAAPAYAQSWAPSAEPGFGPKNQPLAHWWQRLLGAIIDYLIRSLVLLVVAWPWVRDFANTYVDFFSTTMSAVESGQTPPSSMDMTQAIVPLMIPITLIGLAIAVVYECAFLVWRGQTIGKMAMGTTVVRADGAAGITFGVALRRQVITIAAGVLSLLPVISLVGSLASLADSLWLLWDGRRQTLHDKIADTVVVRSR